MGAGWLSFRWRGVLRGCGGVHGRVGGLEVLFFLPDVPVQCTPVLFGEGCLGYWFWSVGGVFRCSLELADMWEMGRAALGGQSGVAWS